MGAMQTGMTNASSGDGIYLEVDTLSIRADRCRRGAEVLSQAVRGAVVGLFLLQSGRERAGRGGVHTRTIPGVAAVKNKFFVQILAPEGGRRGCEIRAVPTRVSR